MLFAIGFMVQGADRSTTTFRHGIFMVSAQSEDEASGKGMRVVRKAYPAAEGWTRHSVIVGPTSNVIDPDGPLNIRSMD